MKDNTKKKKIPICTLVNIIIAIIFFVLEILSVTLFRDQIVNAIICRVVSRGVLGLLLVYNAGYLLFTQGSGFMWFHIKSRQRFFTGIILGIAGLGLVVSALMGHGTNGDPTLIWWREIK